MTIRQRINLILRTICRNSEKPLFGPEEICVYITGKCNLRCWHCRQATDACDGSINGEMSFDLVKKMLAKFPMARQIGFAGFGEPLLHKDIFRFASFSREKYKMRTALITNGVIVKNYTAEICKNFDEVFVSIHGLDKKDFAETTGASEKLFKDFESGVSALTHCFATAGKSDMLSSSFIVNRKNYELAENVLN